MSTLIELSDDEEIDMTQMPPPTMNESKQPTKPDPTPSTSSIFSSGPSAPVTHAPPTSSTDVMFDDEDVDEPVQLPSRPPTAPAPKPKKRRRIIEEEEDEDGGAPTNENQLVSSSTESKDEIESHHESESSPPKKKKKKLVKSLKPKSIKPDPECAEDIEELRQLMAAERKGRTGPIPSLTNRRSAAAIDAQELVAAISGQGTLAERREVSDTFLENLAAKHAKHRKVRKTKVRVGPAGESMAAMVIAEAVPVTIAHDGEAKDGDSDTESEPEQFVVERILRMRVGEDGVDEYLVHWEGYKDEDDTWEPKENICDTDAFQEFVNGQVKREPQSPKSAAAAATSPSTSFSPPVVATAVASPASRTSPQKPKKTSSKPPKVARAKPVTAAAPKPRAKKKETIPSDMEFLMLQEKLGLDKKGRWTGKK